MNTHKQVWLLWIESVVFPARQHEKEKEGERNLQELFHLLERNQPFRAKDSGVFCVLTITVSKQYHSQVLHRIFLC